MSGTGYTLPGELEMLWLIARRAAIEALQDRLTLLMTIGFAIVVPLLLVVVAVPPLRAGASDLPIGDALAFYLLVVGLLPTVSAVGIASGQFAGEKERGVLAPLLASPASNVAIFAGKVLGAILPALTCALMADLVYVIGLLVVLGPSGLGLLPVWLSLTMVALVPGAACFAAGVASLISSRVRTFNAAQQIGGMLLMPLWGIVFAIATRLSEWGPLGMAGVVLTLGAVDAGIIALAAGTWRREEVLAQR